MQFSVTKNGKELSKSLYTWDESTKTFSTTQNNLVLDFSTINGVTFNTGSHCSFVTDSYCTFNTGSHCSFDTGYDCVFNTGSHCSFKTFFDCTFTVEDNCVLVPQDEFKVYELPVNQKVKIEEGTPDLIYVIDGKEIEMSQESFNSLKEYFKEN